FRRALRRIFGEALGETYKEEIYKRRTLRKIYKGEALEKIYRKYLELREYSALGEYSNLEECSDLEKYLNLEEHLVLEEHLTLKKYLVLKIFKFEEIFSSRETFRLRLENIQAESKEFKYESISDEEKTLLENIVTANNTQEESDRNSSILMDIVSIKPITLLSNYGKNILNNVKSTARKRYLTKHEESTTLTNNKLESKQSMLQKRKKEIQAYIQRRAKQIVNDQKKMLNSLLEWPFYKVVLDKVLVQNQDQEILLNDLVEVLEEVQTHFQKQFVDKENSYIEVEKL
ncbi:12108_t:CDS:2, partial [Dentiscutata heterogama]